MSHEVPVASWLTRRDDRARLLAIAALAAGIGALSRLPCAAAALALAVACAGSTGFGPRRAVRRLWPLLALLVPLALLTPLWYRPEGSRLLVAAWGWGPTDAGLRETARIAARVLAMGLVAVTGLDAAPFERTVRALTDLKLPRPLAHTALLTWRYLFQFKDDLGRVRAALSARGFTPRADLATARTYAGVTGGLLVRSLARTERVERAMRCRGYTGALVLDAPRRFGLGDGLLLVGAALLAVALVAWDRGALDAWGLP